MSMSVDIPPELEQFVQNVIDSGRCETESEVVCEALRLFQELDKRREQLRQDIEDGMNSGESILGDKVFDRLEKRAAEIASQNQ